MAKQIDPKLIIRLNNELAESATRMDEHAKAFRLLIEALDSGIINSSDTLKDAIQNAKKLKSINEGSINKFLKNLKLDKKDTDYLLDKYKELDKLGEKGYKRFKDELKSRKTRQDFIDDEIYFTETLTDAFYRLTDEIKRLEKQYRSAGIVGESSMEAVHNAILRAVDVDSIFAPELIDQRSIDDIISSMDNFMDTLSSKKIQIGFDSVEVDEGFNRLAASAKDAVSAMELEAKILANKVKLYAAEMYGYKWFPEKEILVNISTGDKLAGAAYTQTMKAIEKVNAELDEMANQYNSIGHLTDAQIERLRKLGKTELDIAAIAKATDKLHGDRVVIEAYEERMELLKSLGGTLKTTNKLFDNASVALSNMISLVPTPIAEFLGLNEASVRFKSIVDTTFKTFIDGVKKGKTSTEAMSDAINFFGGNVTKVMSGFGALVIAIAGAYKLSSLLSERWKELSKTLGVSLSTAKQIHKNTVDMISASSRYTLNMRELSAIQGEFAETWGLTFTLMDKTALKTSQNLGETVKLFGISEKQAVGLYNEFQKLGADDTLSKTLVRNINYLSELNGLSPQMITQDLLDAAETLQTYYAGYPEDAAKAAIATRKLGVTLKQAGEVAKKMLNIEGFMTDMYELNAMSGIDLSKAFDLGIAGDIEGMSKAIMDSIGSLNEWSNMDYLQRMKLANTLGMSVEEISKSLVLKEKMASMSKDEVDLANKYADKLGDVSMLTDAQVKQKLHELDAADRLNNMFDRFKAILIKSILPLAESFGDLLDGLSPAFEILVGLFRVAGWLLKGILTIVKGILAPFKVLGNMVVGVVDNISSGVDVVTSFANGFDNVKSNITAVFKQMSGFEVLLYSIGGLMGGLWVLKSPLSYLKFGLWPITKSFSILKKMIPSVGGMLGGVFDKIKGITSSKTGGSSIFSSILGDSATDSKKTGASMIDGLKNIGSTLKNGFISMINSIGDVLKTLTTTIGDVFKSLTDAAGEGIENLLSGIGKGLNTFGPKALIGATSLVILASSMYIISEAMGKFASVDWSSIGKATVAMGGLVAMAMLVSKVASNAIVGSVALAIMGASLIPLAYALNMLTDVKWSTLGIAGTALLGLTVALTALGAFVLSGFGAAAILAGAAALAVMGVAIIPLANGLKKLGTSTGILETSLSKFSNLNIDALQSVLSVLISFGKGLYDYPVATSDSIGKSLSTFADIGGGIDATSLSINALAASLVKLSATLEDVNIEKLNMLTSLKSTSQNISASLKVNEKYANMISAMPPPESYTGQGVNIAKTDLSRGVKDRAVGNTPDEVDFDMPSGQELTLERLEVYLKRLVDLFQDYSNRPVVVSVGKDDANRIYRLSKPMSNDR